MNDNDNIDSSTKSKMAWLEQQHEQANKRKALAESFSSFINSASASDIQALAQDMLRDHRTLVQYKFSFFLTFVKELANSEYDARNEFSVKTAIKIMNLVYGVGAPHV
jgi:uncharacterized protein YfiM (DUF2279 family)